MAKQQTVVLVITPTPNGNVNIAMNFHPKLYKSEAEFKALPLDRKMMQNAAMEIGKAVSESLLKKSTLPKTEKSV